MCRALALVSHWLHIHHQPAGRHEGRVTGTPVQGAQETEGGSGQKPSSAPGDALRRLPPPHPVSHAGRVHEAQTSPPPCRKSLSKHPLQTSFTSPLYPPTRLMPWPRPCPIPAKPLREPAQPVGCPQCAPPTCTAAAPDLNTRTLKYFQPPALPASAKLPNSRQLPPGCLSTQLPLHRPPPPDRGTVLTTPVPRLSRL